MKEAKIYHVTESALTFQAIPKQPRKLAGTVMATDPEDAYAKSQNLDGYWNEETPCRSTSVGDVVMMDDHYYLVKSIGFEDITAELQG
jgi:hypothetical protein